MVKKYEHKILSTKGINFDSYYVFTKANGVIYKGSIDLCEYYYHQERDKKVDDYIAIGGEYIKDGFPCAKDWIISKCIN